MKPRSYGSKHISQKRAAAALQQLLYGCTAERLAGFTAQGLSSSFNVPISRAEAMLVAARKERAG